MEQYWPYLWLGVIILGAVLESATAQLVSIWFVVGGVAALLASIFGADLWIQVVAFVVVTLVMVLLTRPLVRKMIHSPKEKTNADRYVGQIARVIVPIDNQQGVGQVKVGGSIWSARTVDGATLTDGEEVIVESIEGVKLMVKKR